MHIDHSSSFSPLSSSPSQVFVPTDVLAAQEVIEKKTENPRSEKILRGLFFDQVENKIVTLLLESGSAPVYDVPMCIVYRGQKPLLKRWSILTTWFTTCADLLRMKKGFEQAIGIKITVILTNTTFLLFWTPKIKVNPEDIVYGITF